MPTWGGIREQRQKAKTHALSFCHPHIKEYWTWTPIPSAASHPIAAWVHSVTRAFHALYPLILGRNNGSTRLNGAKKRGVWYGRCRLCPSPKDINFAAYMVLLGDVRHQIEAWLDDIGWKSGYWIHPAQSINRNRNKRLLFFGDMEVMATSSSPEKTSLACLTQEHGWERQRNLFCNWDIGILCATQLEYEHSNYRCMHTCIHRHTYSRTTATTTTTHQGHTIEASIICAIKARFGQF